MKQAAGWVADCVMIGLRMICVCLVALPMLLFHVPSHAGQNPENLGTWRGNYGTTNLVVEIFRMGDELCGRLGSPDPRPISPGISLGPDSQCFSAGTNPTCTDPKSPNACRAANLFFWGGKATPQGGAWTLGGAEKTLGRIRQVWEQTYGTDREDIGGNEHVWTLELRDNGTRYRVRVSGYPLFDLVKDDQKK